MGGGLHSMAEESEHRAAALEGRLVQRAVKIGMLQRLREAFTGSSTVDGPGTLRPQGPRQILISIRAIEIVRLPMLMPTVLTTIARRTSRRCLLQWQARQRSRRHQSNHCCAYTAGGAVRDAALSAPQLPRIAAPPGAWQRWRSCRTTLQVLRKNLLSRATC